MVERNISAADAKLTATANSYLGSAGNSLPPTTVSSRPLNTPHHEYLICVDGQDHVEPRFSSILKVSGRGTEGRYNGSRRRTRASVSPFYPGYPDLKNGKGVNGLLDLFVAVLSVRVLTLQQEVNAESRNRARCSVIQGRMQATWTAVSSNCPLKDHSFPLTPCWKVGCRIGLSLLAKALGALCTVSKLGFPQIQLLAGTVPDSTLRGC